MKKSLFVLLSLVLIASFALAACGGATPATEAPKEEVPVEEPKEEAPVEEVATEAPVEAFDTYITIWSDDMLTPVLLGFVDAFQSEYGIGLIVENVPDRNDQFPIAAPAGEGPDIIMLAHDRLGGFVDSGLLAPIDLGDKAASFNPAALQAYSYAGQLVGVPYAVENMAFFYNTDMVDAAPATWDELLSVGGALVDAGDATFAIALTGTTYDAYPLMTAFGGYVFGTNENGSYNPSDVGIDSEGMIAAGDFIKAGVDAGYISSSTDWDTAHVQFETGATPFLMAGPWALDRLRESGVPYAITNFPSATAVGAPFSGVQGFAVNALGDNVLLAQAFLTEFLATQDSMQLLAEGSNRPSAWLTVTSDDPDLAAFGKISSIAQPMPNIPEMGSVWGSWGDATTLIINGEQEAADAYGNAAAQIRDLIAGAAAGMVNVPGSWQAASGACTGDWDPACEGSALTDNGDGTYSGTFELAAGDYEGKVAMDGAWTENYGVDGKLDGDNYAFTMAADGSVTFTYDSESHLLTIVTE